MMWDITILPLAMSPLDKILYRQHSAFDRSLFLQKRVRGVKAEWCVVKPCTIDAFSAAITPVLRIFSI